jgi:hypothetical protein
LSSSARDCLEGVEEAMADTNGVACGVVVMRCSHGHDLTA